MSGDEPMRSPDLRSLPVGNGRTPFVFEFDSGRAGPVVLINGLLHGNEPCGAAAIQFLLECRVRPLRGRLILTLANVAAYDAPEPKRFVDRDMNRIWSRGVLSDEPTCSEIERARALLPYYEQAEFLLDLHSTAFPVRAMTYFKNLQKAEALALRIGDPPCHVVTPGALHAGIPLFEFDKFGNAASPAVALLVECGQHRAQASADTAIRVSLKFLVTLGLLDAGALESVPPAPEQEAGQYRVFDVIRARTAEFQFVRTLLGFEEFAKDELIAIDGDRELRAACHRCTVIMPQRTIVKDREVVTLARRMD